MIRQQIGDLLEVTEEGGFFYVVVLTKRVMFGGNILFAFHNDGERRDVASLAPDGPGFNVCADLLWPKREKRVVRLHHYDNTAPFWRTKFAKYTRDLRFDVKAERWYISDVHDLNGPDIAVVETLTPEYRAAMDKSCCSFDLVAQKVLARYTPDQNERI